MTNVGVYVLLVPVGDIAHVRLEASDKVEILVFGAGVSWPWPAGIKDCDELTISCGDDGKHVFGASSDSDARVSTFRQPPGW